MSEQLNVELESVEAHDEEASRLQSWPTVAAFDDETEVAQAHSFDNAERIEIAEQADLQESLRSIQRRLVSVLGVSITDVSKPHACQLLESLASARDGRCRSVFIVNTHTLNVSAEQPSYRDTLNSAHFVLNDGTGVRWAARQRGIELCANLVGTDLIPDFFQATAHRGYRYFLLGAAPDSIEPAAAFARDRFAGWTQAGYHHGFVHNRQHEDLVDQINASGANVLLVGMGNPIQERWIQSQQSKLRVPLAIGVGGLFDHWINRPKRAPLWVRKMGCEWVHKLILQPHKWRRYLLGNPTFLLRIARAKQSDLAAMQAGGFMPGAPIPARPISLFTQQQI